MLKSVSVDALVRKQIEKAEASGRKISYAEAHEEVIADSMVTMLTDGKVIEKLQMLQAKDKSLFEKIKSFISELVEKIKKAYKNVKPETSEGQIVASMLDEIETIQQLFVDAIADASENFKNAEVMESVGNTSQCNKVKYSLNENFANQIDSWDRKTIGFSFVVGTTSEALVKAGIPNQQIRWDASKIKTTIENTTECLLK